MESIFHYRALQAGYSEVIGLFEYESDSNNISTR